jgi:hypothetical protein
MNLKSLLWITLLIMLLPILPGTAAAQVTVALAPDTPSKEDVRKLLDLTASPDQMRRVMEQVFAGERSARRQEALSRNPNFTEEDLAREERESHEFIKNFPLDDMLNDMIPVYQHHFSKSEIDALIAFYSSPVGQKFLHEMPAVTAEAMQLIYPRIEAAMAAAMKHADQAGGSPKK